MPGQEDSPFEAFAEKYDSWFDREGKTIFQTEALAFRQVLPSLPRPWIEIGIGSGRFAEALGIDVGIEPSENLKRMAESRGIRVVKGRGEDQLFPTGSFGTAFIIVTLCFVADPALVLERAYDMLVDSGKLVLGLIAMESPWARYYTRKREEGHPFYGIATFYWYEEILGLLEGAGFVHVETVSTLFQEPGVVDRLERPRSGFFPEAGFIVVVAEKGRK